MEGIMMQPMAKVICRSQISALLLAYALWTPITARANAEAANVTDLSRVRALAEGGSISDEITLAADYFVGNGVPQDSKTAAYWYEKAAGHGDPQAQNQIGYFYQAGIGVPRDFKRAVHWFQLSAASGYATANVNLAIAYLRGIGVEKNDDLAVRLLTQAFQKGNGTGATYLGDLYYFGIGVKEDKAAAERWFESALKLHDSLAAYNLGSLYSVNADHPHDLPKAAELLRLASNAGYVPAMHSLGLLLVNHPELKQGAQEGHELLKTASNAGSWKSTIVLGILARDGRGGPVDDKDAYFNFRLAVLQGGQQADRLVKGSMDNLAARIGDQELQKAGSDAKAWYEHHPVALAFVYKDGASKSGFPAAAIAYAADGSVAGQLLPLTSS
jgi:TPR repeat protein